ncbi:MAG: cell division protein ZapA [Lentimicrobiaceae bacterium]|nr:cell division protein ZapA [Lentimicrobiaceae bacterium]
MAEERESITLYIAQQPLRLFIPAGQEALYRRAESRVQEHMRQLAEKQNINDKLAQLSYAAVGFAINEIVLTDRQKFVNTDLKNNLRKIQKVIQLVLNDSNEMND